MKQEARQEADGPAISFAGKVVLVTGAAGGIGRAVALAFGRAGASVVVADISVDGGHATAGKIVESGGKALFVQADVTRAADIETLLDKAVHHYGRVDCAVNAAMLADAGAPLADVEEERFDRLMDVNLKGVWLSMRAQLRRMLKQEGGGSIVNVSSTLGLIGAPGQAVYAAARHAVAGLTRSAAADYGKDGIRVNAVCAGAVAKRIPGPEAILHGPGGGQPLGRLAEPAEIAHAVLWLCSDQSSFVTGHQLTADGGFTAL